MIILHSHNCSFSNILFAVLEVINVIFVVTGISLVVTGAVFSYEAMAIPGPLGPAAIGAIIVGVVMVLMGILGYKAARDRKIEGKELKGKCNSSSTQLWFSPCLLRS